MTERLADISARIDGIRQLGAVVNAMKGIAAARAHVARTQVDAVDSYAVAIAEAMSQTVQPRTSNLAAKRGAGGVLVFCAEQGFAGAFSERVLDSIAKRQEPEMLFLIGTRGLAVAETRGISPYWSAAMPSHTPGIPRLADQITKAIYGAVGDGRIDHLDMVFTRWVAGRQELICQGLFPLDLSGLPHAVGQHPLTQLPDADLLDSLGQDYFHALVCKAALHAFAAENEVRMQAMTAAGSQITSELAIFQAKLRQTRQEAITAEIIELGTGAIPAHNTPSK